MIDGLIALLKKADLLSESEFTERLFKLSIKEELSSQLNDSFGNRLITEGTRDSL